MIEDFLTAFYDGSSALLLADLQKMAAMCRPNNRNEKYALVTIKRYCEFELTGLPVSLITSHLTCAKYWQMIRSFNMAINNFTEQKTDLRYRLKALSKFMVETGSMARIKPALAPLVRS